MPSVREATLGGVRTTINIVRVQTIYSVRIKGVNNCLYISCEMPDKGTIFSVGWFRTSEGRSIHTYRQRTTRKVEIVGVRRPQKRGPMSAKNFWKENVEKRTLNYHQGRIQKRIQFLCHCNYWNAASLFMVYSVVEKWVYPKYSRLKDFLLTNDHSHTHIRLYVKSARSVRFILLTVIIYDPSG